MILNYIMYVLMFGMGMYLLYLSKSINNVRVVTKYSKVNYAKLYKSMGITFIVFALISFVIRLTFPQYEFILPVIMIIILIYLNKKYRK